MEVARTALDSLVEADAAEIVGSVLVLALSRMVSVVAVAVEEEGRVAVGEASEAAATLLEAGVDDEEGANAMAVVPEDAEVAAVLEGVRNVVELEVVGVVEEVLGSIGCMAVVLAFPLPFLHDLIDLPRCILPWPPSRTADLRSGSHMDPLGGAASL